MTTKHVNLPQNMAFPVRILEVHVSAGQFITAGAPLYTLETADKKRGMMRAPFAGQVTQGPVEPYTSFSHVVPVIGMDVSVGPTPPREDAQTSSYASAETPEPPPLAVPADQPATHTKKSPQHIKKDLKEVVEEQQKIAFLFDLEFFRNAVAGQLMERGHGLEQAVTAAQDAMVESAWRVAQADTGAGQDKSASQDVTPATIAGRALLIILISFLTGIFGAIIGTALETAFPYKFTFALGVYAGSIIAGVFWLVLSVLCLPQKARELVRTAILGLGLGVYTITFVFVGPMGDVGMPYIGEPLYQLTGYSPLEALNRMRVAQVLAELEASQSTGTASQKPAFTHWGEVAYLIGLAIAMIYSAFWAFAPASVYARIQGVPKVRVLMISRLLNIVIVVCLVFLLTSVMYVLLNPACTDLRCWAWRDYNGPALGVAFGSGMLLKLMSTILDARQGT